MSNDWEAHPSVVLLDRTLADLVAVVEVLERALDDENTRPWALVGGLAVQMWAPYGRVTTDVDIDLLDRATAVRVLCAKVPGANLSRNGVEIDGRKVDILELEDPGATDGVDLRPEEVFVSDLNLIWFEALRLKVQRQLASARTRLEISVARPGLLLAAKLGAIEATDQPRFGARRLKEKWGSDVCDVENLVRTLGASALADDIGLADPHVAELCVEWADRWLVGRALELAGRTRMAGEIGAAALSADTIENVGHDLLEAIERVTGGTRPPV